MHRLTFTNDIEMKMKGHERNANSTEHLTTLNWHDESTFITLIKSIDQSIAHYKAGGLGAMFKLHVYVILASYIMSRTVRWRRFETVLHMRLHWTVRWTVRWRLRAPLNGRAYDVGSSDVDGRASKQHKTKQAFCVRVLIVLVLCTCVCACTRM